MVKVQSNLSSEADRRLRIFMANNSIQSKEKALNILLETFPIHEIILGKNNKEVFEKNEK